MNNEDQYEGRYPPDPVLGNNLPLRGWKGSVYEGGIRVPAFAYWPGKLKPEVLDQPIHIVDWYPTLLKLANEQFDIPPDFDGQDISPSLFDPNQFIDHKPIYIKTSDASSLRFGDWKILEFPNGETELYNIRNDPNETANLADSEREKRQEMHSLLQDIQQQDDLPVKGRQGSPGEGPE